MLPLKSQSCIDEYSLRSLLNSEKTKTVPVRRYLPKFWHMAHAINLSALGIIPLANNTQNKYYTFIMAINIC